MAAYAIRKLRRGADGTMQTVFIDASTGQIVQDLNGYTIVDSGAQTTLENMGLGLGATNESENQETDTTAEEVAAYDKNGVTDSAGVNSNKGVETSQGSTQSKETASKEASAGRTAENAFGYKDAPRGLGIAAAVAPGVIGLGAKAAQVGFNANNVGATNAAREAWGMGPTGLMSQAKGLAFGNDEVGGISLKDQDNVSFFSAMNNPNQDPNVASPSTATMSAYSQAQKSKEGQGVLGRVGDAIGQTAGALGGFAKSATSFLDSLFGKTTATGPTVDAKGFPTRPEAPTQTSYGQGTSNTTNANPSGVSIDSKGFPSAPNAPEGLSPGAMGGVQAANVGPSVDTTGMSPGAMGGESQSSAASKSGGADEGAGLY